MNFSQKTELVEDIYKEVCKSTNLVNVDWEAITVVCDLNEGHFSQSGFLYKTFEKAEPFTVKSSERRRFSNLCKSVGEKLKSETGKDLIQLLIQVSSLGNINIDFDFDDSQRWVISPGNIGQMKEALRPKFD